LLAAQVIGMIAVYGAELRRVAGAPGRSVDPGSSEESVVAAGPQLDQ